MKRIVRYQRVRILRSCPERAFGPLFEPGEIIEAKVSDVPGLRGWIARRSTSDPEEWLLEEGLDAEAAGPVKEVETYGIEAWRGF